MAELIFLKEQGVYGILEDNKVVYYIEGILFEEWVQDVDYQSIADLEFAARNL